MKVTVKRASLESALSAAFRAVNPKSPLSIITGIHLSCGEGKLTATGTSIETTIERVVPVEPGAEPGATTVPGKKLYDLVKKIDHEMVELTTSPDAITVRYGKNKTTLKTFSEEFPSAVIADRADYELSAEDFASALRIYPLCHQGTDKPVYTGVCFNITPFGADFTATDTYRIGVSRVPLEGNDVRAVIPQNAIKEAINLLDGKVRITIEKNAVAFRDDNTSVYSMVIAGAFPDLHNLFAKEFGAKFEINPKSILPTLDRIASIQEKANVVKLSLNGSLTLSFDGENSEISERVDVLTQEGNIEVYFNTKYMSEVFQMCADSEKVSMLFGGGLNPCKVETEKVSILILPMRPE